MIYLDTTKTGSGTRHRSGLMRVTTRLREELTDAQPLAWPEVRERVRSDDWFVTAELFSEDERPGFGSFLAARVCRTAAIFHDAIPLKWPQITWPRSVARHPGYMKMLAQFDRVFAVSQASADELRGFWRWQGLEQTPPVTVLPLGADLRGQSRMRVQDFDAETRARLVMVGILEPRKNQTLLLDVAEALWAEGLEFGVDFVGRVNPHFGAPIAKRIRRLQAQDRKRVRWHQAASDQKLIDLYRAAHVTVFPTLAEGCGLPLLESLWMGVPCVCSDLPVLRENADAGGCLPVAVDDREAWETALRRVLTDIEFVANLKVDARTRSLPTWRETAEAVRRGLQSAV